MRTGSTDSGLALSSGSPETDPVPGGRRRRAARGTIINSAFLVGVGTLNLLKSLIVAGFLTASEFGVWSIVYFAFLFVGSLKLAAVSDKYVQQSEPDQERAFQKAFTLDLLSALILMAVMLVLAPVLALLYGQHELLLPGLALALLLPALALQSPIWIFYRRMDFLRQRLLISVDPMVGFLTTIPLAIAGLGYWSLVVGILAGAWAGGVLAAFMASPYPLALRYERVTMREYVAFSWPLLIAVGAGLLIAQLSVLFGELELGLAGAGAIGLAGTISAYADRVDTVITQTIYPAICRVRDRRDLLMEAFTKSNRLALMWGVPFGVGLSLFAADLIEFGIGEQWENALILLQVMGVTAAVNHIGFNWGAFYRAVGNTRPMAVVSVSALSAFMVAAVPLLFLYGLDGFAAGIAIMAAVTLATRWYYVTRLFPGFEIASYMLRAIAPTLPAAAAVLMIRTAFGIERSLEIALAELAVYVLVTAASTLVLERALIREVISYLHRTPPGELRAA